MSHMIIDLVNLKHRFDQIMNKQDLLYQLFLDYLNILCLEVDFEG
jgi:hypothetical protein